MIDRNPLSVIRLVDLIHPDRTIVDTAGEAGSLICRILETQPRATLSLFAVRGVPSSFFNVLLRTVAQSLSVTDLDRIDFETDTESQRLIIDRSMDAVRNSGN